MLGHTGIGTGQQHAQIRGLATRGPHLLSIDDPLVAVPHRPRLQAGEVGPCLRFAEELAPALSSRDDLADVRFDLFLRAMCGDRRSGEEKAQPCRCPKCPELGNLLGDQHCVSPGHPPSVRIFG